MSSPRSDEQKSKVFEIGLPSSEDSFTPSETSEKYEDVVSSGSPTGDSKQKTKERPRKHKANSRKNGSDKSSTNSTSSKLSDTTPRSDKGRIVTEGVQTDDEYLERLSPKSDSIEDVPDASEQILIPKRHVLLLMIFLGFVNIYAMRVNLNVAIVAMVNNKTIILPTGDVKKIVSSINHFLSLFRA